MRTLLYWLFKRKNAANHRLRPHLCGIYIDICVCFCWIHLTLHCIHVFLCNFFYFCFILSSASSYHCYAVRTHRAVYKFILFFYMLATYKGKKSKIWKYVSSYCHFFPLFSYLFGSWPVLITFIIATLDCNENIQTFYGLSKFKWLTHKK